MQESRYAGEERCRNAGHEGYGKRHMRERRNAEQERCRTSRILERRDAEKRDAGVEGCNAGNDG